METGVGHRRASLQPPPPGCDVLLASRGCRKWVATTDSSGVQVGWMHPEAAGSSGARGQRRKTLEDWERRKKEEKKRAAYLRLAGRVLVIAIGSGTQRRAGAVLAGTNTAALGQVLLALRLANLDLCLLATATQLFRLEGALRLELRAAMLGDVAFGHGCDGWSMSTG